MSQRGRSGPDLQAAPGSVQELDATGGACRVSSFMIPPLGQASFERYLAHLRWLVDHPSPFTQPEAVRALMAGVRDRLTRFLPTHAGALDAAGNFIAVPRDLAPDRPLLVLSAHVDTVPGDPGLWTPPFAPHPAVETDAELVAQGVNDCKAGVAAQLWLAQGAAEGAWSLSNVVCTVTFKEEGAGPKSGVELGRAFGAALPVPAPGSTLLVLENTVSAKPPFTPQVYAVESSSFTIRLQGSLAELRRALTELPDWRPVALTPLEAPATPYEWLRYTPLGHVCSAPPEANPLKAALLTSAGHQFLAAGDERSLGTVPSAIGRAPSAEPDPRHRLTITKRGSYAYESVAAELAGREFTPVKPLALSGGFDVTARCPAHPIGQAFLALAQIDEVHFERNLGASDATIITSSMPPAFRDALLPLVCGPGTRSQRSATPPRLTHGPNETFIKSAGARSLALLTEVLRRAGHLS
jgi:hypothetical protein